MSRPIIGISAYREQAQVGCLGSTRRPDPRRLRRSRSPSAGGAALVHPTVDRVRARDSRPLDGLVLAGGADLEPALYGETAARRDHWVAPRPRRR